MTEGELVTAGLSYYLNQGSSSVASDPEQRKRAHFFSEAVADRTWNHAPYYWRKGDGSVTLSSGVGTMPTDFSRFGTEGQAYVNGQRYRPLTYKPPDWLKYQLENNPQSGTPWAYSLYSVNASVAAQGLQELICWPADNSTIDILGYDKKRAELIDAPLAPNVAVGAAGVLTGDYYYAVTNVTARGETELGQISAKVSPSSQKVELTDIPLWWGETVTSRKLYRNKAASASAFYLLDTLSDNTTATYSDNKADGSLGAAAPAKSAAVSGLEIFPDDFHRLVFFEGLKHALAESQGDGRDQKFWLMFDKYLVRMWEEYQQGQNVVQAFPPFPGGVPGHPVWSRWRPPQ